MWTTDLSRRFNDLTITAPASISADVKSGRGDARNWGAATQVKASFNRALLGQAPETAIGMLTYKVEESGGTIEVRRRADAKTAVGNRVVATRKAVRRAKRSVKKQKEILHV